jgi:DNA-binding Lrp family transcriptional regulator
LVFEKGQGRALSAREQAIFSRVEFDPSAGAAEIAEHVGSTASVVNYVLRDLAGRGVIKPRCFINSNVLGYIDVACFFSLSEQTEEERKALVERIRAHPNVAYFVSLLGDYQFVVVMLARSLEHFGTLLGELAGKCGEAFTEKIIAPRVKVARFQRKYLSGKAADRVFWLETRGSQFRPDEADEQLLWVLGNEPFESTRGLARRVGLPIATVDRRVKRLREAGVIEGFFWDLDVMRLGIHSFRVLVRVKGLASSVNDRIFRLAKRHPLVVNFIWVVGAWDFELNVETRDPRDVSVLIEELHDASSRKIAEVRVLMELDDFTCRHYPGKTACGAPR